MFVELLRCGGRDVFGDDVTAGPGLGPGLRRVVGSWDGARVGRPFAGDDVIT